MANTLQETDIYSEARNPTANVNPKKLGAVWINYTTGDTFVCSNNTHNRNVWVQVSKSAIDNLDKKFTTVIEEIRKKGSSDIYVLNCFKEYYLKGPLKIFLRGSEFLIYVFKGRVNINNIRGKDTTPTQVGWAMRWYGCGALKYGGSHGMYGPESGITSVLSGYILDNNTLSRNTNGYTFNSTDYCTVYVERSYVSHHNYRIYNNPFIPNANDWSFNSNTGSVAGISYNFENYIPIT